MSSPDPVFALAAEVAEAVRVHTYEAAQLPTFLGRHREALRARGAVDAIRSGDPARMRKALEEMKG